MKPTPDLSPSVKAAAIGIGFWSMTSVATLICDRVGEAHGHRHDRRVLGPRRRVERDDAVSRRDRAAVKDVDDEFGPGIGRGLGEGRGRKESEEGAGGGTGGCVHIRHPPNKSVIASVAKQSIERRPRLWIASSLRSSQ